MSVKLKRELFLKRAKPTLELSASSGEFAYCSHRISYQRFLSCSLVIRGKCVQQKLVNATSVGHRFP